MGRLTGDALTLIQRFEGFGPEIYICLSGWTGMAGGDSSGARRTLTPLFVETLMGWPAGWTGIGSAAMAWSRWLPRMRGELSRLCSTEMREAA